jgi:glycerol-3-phosphate cytidylyltransferase
LPAGQIWGGYEPSLEFPPGKQKPMKRVLTYGTFDLFHVGHIRLLERARSLGDYLVVGLSTDEFNLQKGKKSVFSYAERSTILSAVRHVDKIVPEQNWDQKLKDVLANEINVFVMGDDWEGKFDFLKAHCEVVYLPRTSGISTTYIKYLISEQ